MSDTGRPRHLQRSGNPPPWREILAPGQGARTGKESKCEPLNAHGLAGQPHRQDEAATGWAPTEAAAPEPQRTRPAPDPRRKALELLTRREHSRRELARKLVDRGFEADMAAQAVDDMAGRGWQDDGRFAQSLARSRMLSGQGPLRIRAELRMHGIDDAGIEAALDACEADWNTLAAELLRRRFGVGCAMSRQETARRGAFLQRRGFDLDAIRYALSSPDE